jgi:K+-sensing histidine kinase KdpD
VRGLVWRSGRTIGNFYVDITRATLYVLLPLAVVATLVLVSQGAIQNLNAHTTVHTLEGGIQTIAQGPAASMEAIKDLGTNGGGSSTSTRRTLYGRSVAPAIAAYARETLATEILLTRGRGDGHWTRNTVRQLIRMLSDVDIHILAKEYEAQATAAQRLSSRRWRGSREALNRARRTRSWGRPRSALERPRGRGPARRRR